MVVANESVSWLGAMGPGGTSANEGKTNLGAIDPPETSGDLEQTVTADFSPTFGSHEFVFELTPTAIVDFAPTYGTHVIGNETTLTPTVAILPPSFHRGGSHEFVFEMTAVSMGEITSFGEHEIGDLFPSHVPSGTTFGSHTITGGGGVTPLSTSPAQSFPRGGGVRWQERRSPYDRNEIIPVAHRMARHGIERSLRHVRGLPTGLDEGTILIYEDGQWLALPIADDGNTLTLIDGRPRWAGAGTETITGDTTASGVPWTYLVDASSAAVTVTLPPIADAAGDITVKKIDSSINAVTVDGDGSETIDESTTAVLTGQYDSITMRSDGTEYWIV